KKQQLLRTIKARLGKNSNILFAYLYGSFLKRKDARDIDIAVYLKKHNGSFRACNELAAELEKSTQYSATLDIYALNDAPIAFAFNVISTGKMLIDKHPDKRASWEAGILSRYQDFKPVLDFYDQRFLRAANP
ncbi:nucleotidyltransferase domain-containing protein, partial [Elusimicrobiota bacterium]